MALPGAIMPSPPLVARRPMGVPTARLPVLVLVPVLTAPPPVMSGPVAGLPAKVLVLVSMVRLPVVVPAAGLPMRLPVMVLVPTRVPVLMRMAWVPVVRVVHVPRLRVVLPGVGGRRGC